MIMHDNAFSCMITSDQCIITQFMHDHALSCMIMHFCPFWRSKRSAMANRECNDVGDAILIKDPSGAPMVCRCVQKVHLVHVWCILGCAVVHRPVRRHVRCTLWCAEVHCPVCRSAITGVQCTLQCADRCAVCSDVPVHRVRQVCPVLSMCTY